ncbi:MAG: transglycosylase SLT domain-containing protein [Vicinamibacteria bacterium]|nr:transglycosylase SLT domain-containing protein [Vicinamibacteria bacterium]
MNGMNAATHGGKALIALVVLTLVGCRASTRVNAPPQAPSPAPTILTTPSDPAPADRNPQEGSNAQDVADPNDLNDVDINAEEVALPEGSTPSAEALQKEALDLCQSAEERLDRGEVEEAIAAVDRAYELMLALPNNGDGAYLQAKEDIRRLAAKIVLRLYDRRASAAAPLTSWDLGLPLVDNDHVRREIASLTTVEWNDFVAGYRRSGQYRPMILAKLNAAGLPSQLSWLPLVESCFKVRALSRAGAFGLWQFIASTGLRYGLSRDRWIDERLDPEKSTDAAIAYLADLHGLFGDWSKALAAYNCGEARVLRLQGRSSDRYFDFWDLYEHLPRETRRYVPRLIAALLIIENPGKHGVSLPEPLAPTDGWTHVRVERSIALDRLDQALGLEQGTLRALNPELRHGSTPRRAYDLKVPADRSESVAAHVSRLPEWSPPAPRHAVHRVRRGETLSQIARRYRTNVTAIMRLNRVRSANRIWPGQRLRIPLRGAR